jgi:transcriptional regulatory protein RtcR
MSTLASGGRITIEVLADELERLRAGWAGPSTDEDHDATLLPVLGEKRLEKIDLFDRVQLAYVIRLCRESETLSEAGRKLFAVTREKRQTANDADRLRKYLARFDLNWDEVKTNGT